MLTCRPPATSSTRRSRSRGRPVRGSGPAGFYAGGCRARRRRGQRAYRYAEFGALAAHLRYVERASRKLARATFYGMSRWQGRLEHKQAFLGRIVDIGAELFAMTAACVRPRRRSEGPGEADELADLFCRQARVRVDALFHALWDNTDARTYGWPAMCSTAATPSWRRVCSTRAIEGPGGSDRRRAGKKEDVW